jgi:hypothetical protein
MSYYTNWTAGHPNGNPELSVADVCRDHDQLMAQARTSDYARRFDPVSGLVHKECAAVSMPTAPEQEVYEQEVREQPATRSTDDVLIQAIGGALGRERKLARQERQQELRALERQIDELRGTVQALLALHDRRSPESR